MLTQWFAFVFLSFRFSCDSGYHFWAFSHTKTTLWAGLIACICVHKDNLRENKLQLWLGLEKKTMKYSIDSYLILRKNILSWFRVIFTFSDALSTHVIKIQTHILLKLCISPRLIFASVSMRVYCWSKCSTCLSVCLPGNQDV